MKTACNFHWCCLPGAAPNCLPSSLLARGLVGVGPRPGRREVTMLSGVQEPSVFSLLSTVYHLLCSFSTGLDYWSLSLCICRHFINRGVTVYSSQTSLSLPVWPARVLLWRSLSSDEDSTLCLKPTCIFSVNSAHTLSSRVLTWVAWGSPGTCLKRESAALTRPLVQGSGHFEGDLADAIVSQGLFCRLLWSR